MKTRYTKGFIALISVIVISAILLMLVFTLGLSSFFNRYDALDAENKRISLGLAEACVNVAMVRIAKDSDYGINPPIAADGECVSVSDTCGAGAKKVCKICSVTDTSFPKTISTRAAYNGAYTNVSVAINNTTPGNFTLRSWSEVPTGPSDCTPP